MSTMPPEVTGGLDWTGSPGRTPRTLLADAEEIAFRTNKQRVRSGSGRGQCSFPEWIGTKFLVAGTPFDDRGNSVLAEEIDLPLGING